MTADAQEMIFTGDGRPVFWSAENLPEQVTMVPVDSLSVSDSPRRSGTDLEHVRLLAAAPTELPPILVHYPTMRVIDGVHRIAAARLRSEERIAVTFYHGEDREAFVLAVRANSTHGLPLSLADRKLAAARIVESHPGWSDRYIASVTSISARTVAEVRAEGGGEPAQTSGRIGRDGRVRPVNSAQGRRLAVQLIDENPELSLRQIARAAGISPETARDVRNKIGRGEDPIADRRSAARPERREQQKPGIARRMDGTRQADPEIRAGMRRLRSDPALSNSEAGRILLELLNAHSVGDGDWKKMGESVPPHWGDIIASLAFECGKVWDEFAQRVEERAEGIA